MSWFLMLHREIEFVSWCVQVYMRVCVREVSSHLDVLKSELNAL